MRAGLVLPLLLAATAGAQGAAPGVFETTVTGEGRRQPGEVALGQDAVRDTGAQSAVDALEWNAALSSSSGSRGERIFSLRGFDQRQVAVLLDGAPFQLPYDGQLDLAMVPAALVEHVEFLQGPGSTLVGPNGLGGAVNIVTRRGGTGPLVRAWGETSPSLGTELRVEHSLRVGHLGWTVTAGDLRQSAWPLAAGFEATPYEPGMQGLRSNSDKRLSHVALAMNAALSPTQSLSASAWLFDGERGVPPSTIDDRPRFWRFSVWRAINAQVGHRYASPAGVVVDTLTWVRFFDNRLDSYDNGAYRTQTTPRAWSSWYHDPVTGLRSRATWTVRAPWGPLHVRGWLGGQYELHTATANNAAPEHYERVTLTFAPEVETTFGRRLTAQLALQGDAELPLALPSVTPGAALGPRLSASWRPMPGLSLGATGARTARFPGLKERFSTGLGFREPNPALGPEAAWSLTGELRWAPSPVLELLVLGGHSAVDGLIADVRLANGLVQLQNIAHAQLSSGELKAAWQPWSQLRLEGGLQLLRAVQLADAGAVPLDYRAPVTAVVQLRASPVPWLFVWAGVRASAVRPFANPDTHREDALPAFADVSLRVELRPARGVSTWFRVTNLFDAAVDSQYGFPRQGRQLFVGLAVDLDAPQTPGDTT